MPPHYAISEAFIVLAALYCGWRLARQSQWMGAIGILLFGAAASIGVYRFPTGQVEELAAFHRWAGQIGGLTGMALIASELLRNVVRYSKERTLISACLFALVVTVSLAIAKPNLAVPFFLLWTVISILAAFAWPAGSNLKRFQGMACTGLMLLNVIFLRQSSFLSQDISWHAFHTVVAIWIFGIYWLLTLQYRSVKVHGTS